MDWLKLFLLPLSPLPSHQSLHSQDRGFQLVGNGILLVEWMYLNETVAVDPVKGLSSAHMERARNIFGQYQGYQ